MQITVTDLFDGVTPETSPVTITVVEGTATTGGGGGVSDHGALTGLADDDHTQYHTDARGDARYWALSTDLATQAELDTHAADTTSVHGITDTSALATDAEVATAVSDHTAAANPHPTYLTQAEGDAAYDALGAASSAVATHEADTTSVHGIADTSALATTASVAELARDALGTALTAGTGITVTPNDGADTITVASSITQYTDEMARDALGTALVAGTNVTITPNDGADTITIAATGGGGSTVKDRRWNLPSGWTTIDEHNDDSLSGSWVQVDAAGGTGRVAWAEAADVLSVSILGGDASQEYHAKMFPLSGVGGALADGDAIVGHVQMFSTTSSTITVAGIALSDGTTHGAGNQVMFIHYTSGGTGSMDTRGATGFNNDGGTGAGGRSLFQSVPYYMRIVRTAANTWRGDVSLDGVSWLIGTATTSKTITPTHAGYVVSSYGSAVKGTGTFEFLRRMAGVS